MKPNRFNKAGVGCLMLCTLLAIGGSSATLAQEPEDDFSELMQLEVSDIRGMSANLVRSVMDTTVDENDAFWTVFKEYEIEYGKLFDQMEAVIEYYEVQRDTMDDKKAEDLAERVFDIDEAKVRLDRKYYREFCKVITPKRATQLFQVWRRIDLLVDLKIASSLPIIGEDW